MCKSITFDEYLTIMDTLHKREKIYRDSVNNRARDIAESAGIDRTLCFLLAHNLYVGHKGGNTRWQLSPDVLKACHDIRMLEKKQFEAYHIVSSYSNKLIKRVVWPKHDGLCIEH